MLFPTTLRLHTRLAWPWFRVAVFPGRPIRPLYRIYIKIDDLSLNFILMKWIPHRLHLFNSHLKNSCHPWIFINKVANALHVCLILEIFIKLMWIHYQLCKEKLVFINYQLIWFSWSSSKSQINLVVVCYMFNLVVVCYMLSLLVFIKVSDQPSGCLLYVEFIGLHQILRST